MKKVIITLSLVLCVTSINAQEQCLTVAPAPPQWIFNQQQSRSQTVSYTYQLNIFVHIVRSSNGRGLGIETIPTILNSLNDSFSNTNIQFVILGSEFINNEYFYSNLNGKEDQLFSINPHHNAIDIYILGTSTV